MSQPSPPEPDATKKPANGEPVPVLGDFEILERIGQGAVGAVFKARQRSMDRLVAVKVLKPRLAEDPSYVERFWREARAAARLSHPNIVLAIDAGEAHGYYYFVMEYVEGHPVSLLRKAAVFEERRALEVVLQVAKALDYAWSQERIVHRDIKPGNIIITPGGTAKLADLGLAQDVTLADDEVTEEGKVVGTPLYLSPEQIRRQPDLDIRCDIYALGATLFHMVTGRPPFRGPDSKTILAKHLHDPVPDPRDSRPELSEGVAQLIHRMMAKDREHRYPDAKALVVDIESLLETGHLPGRGPRPAPAIRRVPPRRPRVSASQVIALCLVFAAMAGAVLAIWKLHEHQSRQRGGRGSPGATRVGVTTGATVERPSPAELAYEKAMAYAEAHRDELVRAIALFQGVETAHPNTTYAKLAAARREQLERDLEDKARESLDQLVQEAGRLLAEGQYAQALAAFDRFPRALATAPWLQSVAEARKSIEVAARQRFEAALVPGDKAAAEDRLAEALAAYGGIQGSLPPAWQKEVAARIAKIEQRQEELAGRARAEAEAAHQRLLARIASLYRKRQYDQAAALIQEGLDAAPPDKRGDLQRELDEISRLSGFWKAVEKGAATFIGQRYSIRGIPGTLSTVSDGRITITTASRPFSEELTSLKAPEVLKFAAAGLPARDLGLATARFLIAEGEVGEARGRLTALEAQGVDVSAQRTRLQTLYRSALLAAALAELEQARKAADPEAALREFIARYHDEPAAAELCAEASRLLEEAAEALPPAMQGQLPAQVRVACDGPYQLFLNGKPVASGEGRQGALDDHELQVKDGDVLAAEATSQGAHRGFYTLLDVDGGRFLVPTDATWQMATDAPEGWRAAPKPPGTWRDAVPVYSPQAKPGYEQLGLALPGYWVWGEGERSLFHKVIRLRRTAADLADEERKLQAKLTEKHGQPARATLLLTCNAAYRLYHNGRLVGLAATVVPATPYVLSLRQGDVLGVHAVAADDAGWLDARIEVADRSVPLSSDRSWVWTEPPAPEGWNSRGAPHGVWRAAERQGEAGHRIWGSGRAVLFRKTVNLERLRARRPEAAQLIRGELRFEGERRIELAYDFRDPEQLADWHSPSPLAWSKGRIGRTDQPIYTEPYWAREIVVEVELEPATDLVIGLWGRSPGQRTGYTLSVSGERQPTVVLRRRYRTLEMERATADGRGTRHVLFRRFGRLLIVEVDGRRAFSARDDDPIADDELWRVGFLAAPRAHVKAVRITGRLDWDRLLRERRRSDDRPRAAGEARPAP